MDELTPLATRSGNQARSGHGERAETSPPASGVGCGHNTERTRLRITRAGLVVCSAAFC